MAFDPYQGWWPDADGIGLVFAANDPAAKSCTVWWSGPETDFLHRMRAEARARGVRLIERQAVYSRFEINRAVKLIYERRLRFRAVGFDLRAASGPTPDFRSITVIGVALADPNATKLAPEMIASVRGMVAGLLRDSVIDPDDVKIECSRSRATWFE
jgi:hypothetical protein